MLRAKFTPGTEYKQQKLIKWSTFTAAQWNIFDFKTLNWNEHGHLECRKYRYWFVSKLLYLWTPDSSIFGSTRAQIQIQLGSCQVNWPRQAHCYPPPLCELVAEELLLGLLVDLSQHLVHHAEQRTAQAQQLIQEHIVMWVAPDVGPHSCERLTHTSKQPSRQHTHSPTSTPRPAQASPKQGNQGTWGLGLDAARRRVAPAVHWRGCDTVHLHKWTYTGGKWWNTTYSNLQ